MSAITSILSTDLISASRSTINTNFQNLNADKVETSVLTGTYLPKSSLVGYALQAAFGSINPIDNTTYYWGFAQGTSPSTTPDTYKMYIPKSGTIKFADIYMNNQGIVGTAEASSVLVRINNTTDVTVSAAVQLTSSVMHASTALSQPVTVGDYFEVKWVNPTYATNPTVIRGQLTLYIE